MRELSDAEKAELQKKIETQRQDQTAKLTDFEEDETLEREFVQNNWCAKCSKKIGFAGGGWRLEGKEICIGCHDELVAEAKQDHRIRFVFGEGGWRYKDEERREGFLKQAEELERIRADSIRVVESSHARLSLICGLLSLIPISIVFSGFILSIAAIAFGIRGLNTINKGSKLFEYTGKGKAIGGIFLGSLMLLLRLLGVLRLFTIFTIFSL